MHVVVFDFVCCYLATNNLNFEKMFAVHDITAYKIPTYTYCTIEYTGSSSLLYMSKQNYNYEQTSS